MNTISMTEYINKFNLENCTCEEDFTMNWFVNFDYLRFEPNGDIVCKASKEALETLETQNLAVALLWETSLDLELVGEDGCAGNWDMYTPIYSPHTDRMYLVLGATAEKWKNGEEVTIYCRFLDNDERKELDRRHNEE